jgi:UDP-N-acetyl-D-galactosamine dehydrogenase
MSSIEHKIFIVGLGYVGLPLAVEFAKVRDVVGFDTNPERIRQLIDGFDKTGEVSPGELQKAKRLLLTSDEIDLETTVISIFIVTVPTPIDVHRRPDLEYLFRACQIIGKKLKKGDLVVFESTVYPGCTEEDCVPILEKESGLRFNVDFYCGYSPERLNPGDRSRRLPDIMKVVSGSNPESTDLLAEIYGQIVTAGIHKAESIKVAEAAKVIENTQRDLNIALVNELSIIFDKMGIDTEQVLSAAETKWNFVSFRPGLVGGHCIGVDPYYLTHKAQALGYIPEIILAGRKLNDSMPSIVAGRFATELSKRKLVRHRPKVLILGLTFKENVPDLRNSKGAVLVSELKSLGMEVQVFDPVADPEEARRHFGIELISWPPKSLFDGILIAVGHREFKAIHDTRSLRSFLGNQGLIFDLKHVLSREDSDLRL